MRPGLFAALFAARRVRDYSHFILSAQSDTMIVSLCLAAIDCQLSGRHRWAFWLWILGSLGRPEVWPFLGLYSLWRVAQFLRCAGCSGRLLLIPLLWFGIPALTAKSFFIAGDNALHSPRELHSNKLLGTLDRFLDLRRSRLDLAALERLALAIAAVRRHASSRCSPQERSRGWWSRSRSRSTAGRRYRATCSRRRASRPCSQARSWDG